MARFLVVLALLSGCSVTLQAKPKTVGVATSANCSTSSGYWIADAALAGVAVAAAGTGVVLGAEGEHKTLGQTMAGVGFLAGVLYLASMGNGRKWANECAAQPAPVATR